MSAYESDTRVAGSVASVDTQLSQTTDKQLERMLYAKQQSHSITNGNRKRDRRRRDDNSGVLFEKSLEEYKKTEEYGEQLKQMVRGSLDKLMSNFSKSAVKTDEDLETIKQAFSEKVLFGTFSTDQINQMAKACQIRKLKKNSKLFTEGDFGDKVYVVKKGLILLEKEQNSETHSVQAPEERHPGDCFGELALIYQCPRQMSARVLEDSELWELTSDAFRKINAEYEESKRIQTEEALRSVPLLKGLREDQLLELVSCVEMIRLSHGTSIINKGDEGNTFFILTKGSAEVFGLSKENGLGNEEGAVYCPGDWFGERALLEEAPRAANVVATSDVELLAVSRESFLQYLGDLREILETNMQLRVLETAPVFKDLDRDERLEMCKNFVVEKFKRNMDIIKQGQEGNKLYIIKSGIAEVQTDIGNSAKAKVASLVKGDYFGDSSLITKAPTNATIKAVDDMTCYTLDRGAFEKLMESKAEQLKKVHIDRQRQRIAKTKSKSEEMIQNTTLKELKNVTVLGSGCFGLVKLVHFKKLNASFAMKQLEKGAIVKNHQQMNIFNEKNLLLKCDHPFIVKLYRTFKDKFYLYFMMEFVQGGEVFNFLHVENDSSFPDPMARFYIACVVDAMHYLHKLSIVYRDLKPENLMIDERGYVRMVDFGFAKKLVFKTFTVCGTAQYLAPEILVHRGYSKSVDYWTIGILIYEFFTGTTPFRNKDREILFDNILHKRKIRFSRNFSDGAKDLCMKLLHKRPRLRLGMQKNGTQDLKNHFWFNGLDWEALVNKELPTPWIPKIKGELDHSNFEEYDMEDSPLRGKYDKLANKSEGLWDDF